MSLQNFNRLLGKFKQPYEIHYSCRTLQCIQLIYTVRIYTAFEVSTVFQHWVAGKNFQIIKRTALQRQHIGYCFIIGVPWVRPSSALHPALMAMRLVTCARCTDGQISSITAAAVSARCARAVSRPEREREREREVSECVSEACSKGGFSLRSQLYDDSILTLVTSDLMMQRSRACVAATPTLTSPPAAAAEAASALHPMGRGLRSPETCVRETVNARRISN